MYPQVGGLALYVIAGLLAGARRTPRRIVAAICRPYWDSSPRDPNRTAPSGLEVVVAVGNAEICTTTGKANIPFRAYSTPGAAWRSVFPPYSNSGQHH